MKKLRKKLKNIKVIARMLPHDKSRLVRICEEMNLVVGMTGDGVNDAPALKKPMLDLVWEVVMKLLKKQVIL